MGYCVFDNFLSFAFYSYSNGDRSLRKASTSVILDICFLHQSSVISSDSFIVESISYFTSAMILESYTNTPHSK